MACAGATEGRIAAADGGRGEVKDLRSFLAGVEAATWRVREPVPVVQAITALQHVLSVEGRYPVIRVDRPVRADGTESALPVVTNLFASRERVAAMLGYSDHRESAVRLGALAADARAPVTVARREAPVQAMVREGASADLLELPALRQHALDVGHYITAGHCTTIDPESGIDNTSLQRCWVREPRLMTFYPYEASHNWRNVQAWWARNEPCPFALWIGHHPAVVLGSQVKLRHPESHWAAAGGIAGEPVRLVPTLTHGDRLKVPADAEIVIEGWVPPHRLEADGPFAEYTGYVGVQTATPVVEVTCITRRADAIYTDFGGGLEDHLIPENMAMEARLYALVKPVAPTLVNVHVPFSGRRFHAYLQFRNPARGEVRDALAAALAFRRVRAVVAVDEDIDLFDDRSVLWAVATRVQWHRDVMTLDGLTHPNLDPSLPPGATTITKSGIDATWPPARVPGRPKPVPPANTVSDDALATARAIRAGADGSGWPQA
jgi:4-hydroxy-3-polyprenylbenzoate decarboxylase